MEKRSRSMKKCLQKTTSQEVYALHCKIMNASKKKKIEVTTRYMINALKMADKNIQIADIVSSNILPIVVLKNFEIELFVMGYHVYKSIWIQTKDEHLHAVMRVTNELDKYGVAAQTDDSKVVGHLLLGKSSKFAKSIFYYLKTSENNVCIVVVTGKPVNQGDRKRMKVLCSLQFTAAEKVLKATLETLI